MRSQSVKAQATTLLASLMFALMAFLVKVLSVNLSGAEILFIRAIISILLLGAVLLFVFKGRLRIRNLNMLMVRGLFGGFAVLLYFTAISRIPLSSAAMLANAYPVFAILFSVIIVKERPNLDSLFVLLLAFGGMFLILEPRFGKIDIGYFMALAAAVFGGVAVASIRELRKTDSSWMITLAQMVGAALFSLALLPGRFVVPDARQWGLLLLVGILGTGAQLAFSKPFKFLPTAEGSMVAPVYTAFTVVLAVLFLGEVMTLRLVMGFFLVFGSIMYLLAREEVKFRRHLL
ncbi:MAG: DMT family transporter [Candidatus Margulisbacteria bacterium]|nr:DMT family transporter [Candidatus Margulisiibacteriota bacterium]